VLVGIGLVAVYLVYSRLTSPWLIVERKQAPVPKQSRDHEKQPVFTQQAAKWFEQDRWVQNANARFRDGQRLLFFNDYELENNSHSIAISPVALLWQQDDGEQPITATADSAQLNSSSPFDMQGGKFGKIVSGFLAGDVHIAGPDGLSIEGSGFHISEDAMKIWTSQPVKFAWETHSGRAESGAEIELLASKDSAKSGLMAVNDVQRIRLRGRVHCNLCFKDRHGDREPVQMTVSAANGFEFFVPTKQATFHGFVDQKVNMDNQVLVERPMPNGTLDRLHCARLDLMFQPKIRDAAAGQKSTQLQLSRIIAEGQPAEFRTIKDDEDQVYAAMGKMVYHLNDHRLELMDRSVAADGSRIPVEVHQNGTKLTTAYSVVTMTEDNDVQAIQCRGEGRIGPSTRIPGEGDQSEKPMLGAAWKESLVMLRGEEPRITLTGAAKVVQASRQPTGKLAVDLSLAGDRIDMLLDETAQESPAAESVDKSEMTSSMQGMSLSNLSPRQLVATGNVSMLGQGVNGEVREKLTVTFQKTPALVPEAGSIRTVSQTAESTPGKPNGKTQFSSDTVEAVVLMVESSKPQFDDVWLKGNIEISNESVSPNESKDSRNFKASGNMLHAAGGFRENTEISLFGDPAVVVSSDNRIEGQRIDLTEMKATSSGNQRQARVDGSGRIRFVVNRGLDGKPLEKDSPLDIYWGQEMSYSGRTAHFVGNVRAVLNNELDHDVELTCAGLKVHFSEDVKLEPSGKADEFRLAESGGSQAPSGDIERIECESRVVVKIDIMTAGAVTARHYAEFADLEFNALTGDFKATGPGLIESVQPDKGQRGLAASNRTVARSNTPAKTSEEAFYYIRAQFIGALNGNSHSEYVRLKQHVRGTFGPVRELTDRLNIDGLNAEELPDNAGALECENLSISAVPSTSPDQQSSFSLVAESNSSDSSSGTRRPCRFESRLFAGLADKIMYDHSKQQFILLADEGRQATVSNQRDGGDRQVLNGGRFEYYRDKNHLKANQITGVQSTGDLAD